jgi:hypothetical protein
MFTALKYYYLGLLIQTPCPGSSGSATSSTTYNHYLHYRITSFIFEQGQTP